MTYNFDPHQSQTNGLHAIICEVLLEVGQRLEIRVEKTGVAEFFKRSELDDMYEPVLVLNANFEPIHVCTTRRAVVLVISGKADLVMNGRGVIHTVSRTYPRPSIIRLSRMVKRPRLKVRLSKREILRRDNFTCQYCGQQSTSLTVDHVLPRRLGGEHTWDNLVAACPNCNHRKGGNTVDQAHMRLLRRPQKPPKSARYYFARHLRQNEDWVQFIEGW